GLAGCVLGRHPARSRTAPRPAFTGAPGRLVCEGAAHLLRYPRLHSPPALAGVHFLPVPDAARHGRNPALALSPPHRYPRLRSVKRTKPSYSYHVVFEGWHREGNRNEEGGWGPRG